jgi:Ca2+-binding RTX toxin-like protein
MATVTLGSRGVDMSSLTFAPTAQVLDATDTRYRVLYTTGNSLDYGGSFTYSIDGGGGYYGGGGTTTLSGGTINSLEYRFGGDGDTLAYHADGLAMSVSDFSVFVARSDYEGMLAQAFSASDGIDGGVGSDLIEGFTGDDTIRALDGDDQVRGGDGGDLLNGNLGNDVVHGDAGADMVSGGKGDDVVYGDDCDDVYVNGNIGNDTVYGGAGNDGVFGGQNNDVLYGEAGDDVLTGDLGNDTLFGGAGADRFAMLDTGGQDTVGDFNFGEGDRIQLPTGASYSVGTATDGSAVISFAGGAASLTLTGVAAASVQADWIVFG